MSDPVVLRNRYRVIDRLGSGGGGSVYVVEDLSQRHCGGERLALKALFPQSHDDGVLEGLRQEFRVLATLQHPLLARVYDFGVLPADSGLEAALSSEEGYFLTRDLIEGSDLAAHARQCDLPDICGLAQRSAQLLDLLHRAGMIHGDFKPANVIVDERQRVHLIDFGLAAMEGRRGASGTAAYLAPEMLRGAAVDRRADLYSLGISLYQLATGRLPLPGAPVAELISWHLDGPPLSVRAHLPEAPIELEEAVARLTQRDPDKRYPSAAEAALALANACRAAGGSPHGPLDAIVPRAAHEALLEPLSQLEDFTLRRRDQPDADEVGVAVVVGEPGAGKTTLLRELAWRRQLDGFEVLRAEFQQSDPRPYGSLHDLLDQVAGLTGHPHPIAAGYAPDGSGISDAREDFANRRYSVLQQVADYLVAAARSSPLVLLLDNVEQAAAGSVEALRFLSHARIEAPLAIVLAVGGESPVLTELGGALSVATGGLPPGAIARAIHALAGRHDQQLAARIHEHTGGNPRFVHDVLRALDKRGWPTAFDLQSLLPPADLEQMYAQRWQQASPNDRRVLELLALLGRPAPTALITELLAQAETAAAAALNGEQVRQLLERLGEAEWVTRSDSGAWAFSQGRVASIVCRWLTAQRARDLHRALVAFFDRQADHDPIERTRHALGAGDIDLAWRHLASALGQLRRLGAHGHAARLGAAAAALLDDAPSAHPLRGQLDQLRYQLGQLHRLAGDYRQAESQLSPVAHGDPSGDYWNRARVELARVWRASGSTHQALELLAPLLAQSSPTDRASALLASAEAYADLDQHGRVLELTQQGLERPEALPAATRAALGSQRAWSLGHMQRPAEATQAFDAALDAARAADDQREMVDILNRWAVISWRQGSYAEVAQRYSQALEIAERTGDIERAAVVRFNLAAYHLQRQELAAALAHLPESLRLFEAIGAHQKAASARCNLGQLQLELGLHEQARYTLEQARDQMAQLGRKSGQGLATLLLALVGARHQRFEQARRGIAEARALYSDVGQGRDAADALLDLAEVELDAGAPAAALAALRTAAEEVELDQLPDLRTRATTLEARAAAAQPQAKAEQAQAMAALARVAQLAQELDSPRTDWQCHFAAMMLAEAQGDMRRALDEGRRATSILERIAQGLPLDIQRAFWADERRRQLQQRIETLAREIMSSSDHAGLEATAPAPVRGGGATADERFYRLLEIYRRINSELDSDRLLGMVMDTAVELTGAERGFLLLAQPDGELRTEVARNLDPSKKGYSYSRSIAERAFRTEQPVVTVSAHQDPRFSEYASVHQLQLESVLCIPIHAPRGVMGVLYMESRFRSGRFRPEDQRLLIAFGDQVAIALTNARFYEQVQQQARELEQAKAEIERLADQRARLLAERTAELEQAERDLASTRRQVHSGSGRFGLVGLSEPMVRLYELIERVAPADLPVLVEGESGTGKEMVARAIHQQSRRRKKRLVSVNCAAIPENLLESELFGHVRGAFTGADRDRKGLFAVADGGTLFLDEIGDMPMRMQVDLLRALQEQVIRPVGAQRDIKVDVRVVAASNKSLAKLVSTGEFREDLFYRLHVVQFVLPALRERTDDIPLLVDYFLGKIGDQFGGGRRHITRGALAALAEYGWPGNVRQLEHALMNAVVLSSNELLDTADFRLESPRDAIHTDHRPPAAAVHQPQATTPAEREKARILAALEQCGGNKTKAAQALEMPRRTFYRRLNAYGID